MKFQFEGFKEGDKVVVSNHFNSDTLVGVLDWMAEGLSHGGPLVQCDLVQEDGERLLLESGPGALETFSFSSIKKL